jgi:hypothetical protein
MARLLDIAQTDLLSRSNLFQAAAAFIIYSASSHTLTFMNVRHAAKTKRQNNKAI